MQFNAEEGERFAILLTSLFFWGVCFFYESLYAFLGFYSLICVAWRLKNERLSVLATRSELKQWRDREGALMWLTHPVLWKPCRKLCCHLPILPFQTV